MQKVKQVGNVKVSYLNNNVSVGYSDGDMEDELLQLFAAPNSEKIRERVLKDSPTWANYYHLSPVRGAVIDWFTFKSGASVLEIGAGPGAVTEALVGMPIKVTALELTERRALINAERNKKAKNLEIVVGNLQELSDERKFDYAVCIGVLEYAGTFIDHKSPYSYFLELIRKHLKPDGVLILAIENKNGLKYWAGAKEDHTGHVFDGINDYPNKSVRTFGRIELEKLFMDSGFRQTDFYYPFPDYKHPKLIYSEDYHPGNGADFPLGLLPTPVPGQMRTHLFSEAFAMQSVERNKLFTQFSNSFIVVGQNEQ